MKTIKVKCENCGNEFDKLQKEYNRCIKKDMGHFCSRSCVCQKRNENMPNEYWENHIGCQNIKNFSDNRLDILSPFRAFINKGRASIIKHKDEIDVDELYLKEIWENQKGICPYTGIQMFLPKTCKQSDQTRLMHRASLDRIDSSKGYLKGNVEFICYGINLAKNNFTKEEVFKFVELIQSSRNTLGITQSQPT